MHKGHKANPVDKARKLNVHTKLEDVLDVFWTSYVCSIYVLRLPGNNHFSYLLESILHKWPKYLNNI